MIIVFKIWWNVDLALLLALVLLKLKTTWLHQSIQIRRSVKLISRIAFLLF